MKSKPKCGEIILRNAEGELEIMKRQNTYHTKIILIGLTVSLVILFSIKCLGQDSIALSNAIYWLLTDYEPQDLSKTISSKRKILAKEFIEAGNKFNVPPLLLVVRTFFESRYRKDIFELKVMGKRGELGLMQVGKQGNKYCSEYCMDLSTSKMQIECGACWLSEGVKMCKGDYYNGLIAYATGKCETNSPVVKWKIDRAINLWIRLKKLINEERL